MSKKYFFQAGSFPNLSYVELVSVFQLYGLSKDNIHLFTEDIFVIKSDDVTEEILSKIFNRLGGFVRKLSRIQKPSLKILERVKTGSFLV
jgi:hypothetical protein